MKNEANIRQTTFKVLDQYEIGDEFSSHDLRSKVMKKIFFNSHQIKRPFHDTILRYLRYANRTTDMRFECTSRKRSTYKRIA